MIKSAANRGLPALIVVTLAGAAGTGCLHDPIRQAESDRRESFEMLTRAQRMKDQGDYLLARDLLLRAAETSERPVIYYEIANTHYLLDNPEQAEPYYERAVELAPDYELAQAELDLVRLEVRRRQLEAEQAALEAAARERDRADAAAAEEAASARESLPLTAEPAVEDEAPTAQEALEPAIEVADAAPPAEPTPTATATPAPTPTASPEPVERSVTDVFTEEDSAEAEEPESISEVPEEETLDPESDEIAEQILPAEEAEPAPPAPASPADAPARAAGGAFGGFARAFGAATASEQPRTEIDLDEIDLEAARRSVFPELTDEAGLPSEELAGRARTSQATGRFDEAVRRWERYLAREPDEMTARLAMAESLYRSGRSRRAEEAYQEAVRREPGNPEVHFAQGNFRVQTRNFSGAERSFRQALELAPDHLRARNNLGAALLEAGRPAEAVAEFRAVLEADENFLSGWLNLALALDDLGRPAGEVLPALETYARLSGQLDPEADRWLRSLRRSAD